MISSTSPVSFLLFKYQNASISSFPPLLGLRPCRMELSCVHLLSGGGVPALLNSPRADLSSSTVLLSVLLSLGSSPVDCCHLYQTTVTNRTGFLQHLVHLSYHQAFTFTSPSTSLFLFLSHIHTVLLLPSAYQSLLT